MSLQLSIRSEVDTIDLFSQLHLQRFSKIVFKAHSESLLRINEQTLHPKLLINSMQ